MSENNRMCDDTEYICIYIKQGEVRSKERTAKLSQ